MEHNDREYRDLLNEGLRSVEPSDGLHAKVRDNISHNVVHMRHRNTALGTVAVAIVLTMALSSVTPVFGRNGTLPQVITAMAAERQAQKMTEALGTTTVEQTSAALLVPEATVQAVADSALSETDSILALVIADRAGKPVGEVIALRTQGLGWGVIMAQLGVYGRDISEAVGQAQALAVAGTPSTANQGQGSGDPPDVSNKNGDKVVVNGEIALVPPVSPTSITVAGKTFAIVADTQMKYHGKAITVVEIFTKRAAGMLYATVQGTQISETSLQANLIIVQDAPDSTEQEQEEPEQPKISNEQQIRGKVILVVPLPPAVPVVLRVEGFDHDIVLNAATNVEWAGAGKSTLADIKIGQTVQVHVILSGTTYTAQQVHIETKYVKPNSPTTPDTESGTQGNGTSNKPDVSNKNGDKVVVHGEIAGISPTSITVAGKTFAIVADTQLKYHGKAILPLEILTKLPAAKLYATIQGTQLSETNLQANLIIVQDGPDDAQEGKEEPEQQSDPSVKTWQGTISGVISPTTGNLGAIILVPQSSQPVLYRMTPTSVLKGLNPGTATLADLAVGQNVTIKGRLLTDGTVELVKLTVTVVSPTTTLDPTNPGKGKGSDKPGKN